ncbi:uncharacterized protein LOC118741478 [Rhagoletis pomonella]|uniref:uncharacterized protein LOC118741478 n=1 Tax=Rhagoletis pomonella TaxID=28610 RepID=UPI00177B8698|nr:uncharacterized protein LOC118741478 [Rhagoletis pomonella]
MSWRVRRFLKQVRENRREGSEIEKEVTTKRVSINDTPESKFDNQLKPPLPTTAKSVTINEPPESKKDDTFEKLNETQTFSEDESHNLLSASSASNEESFNDLRTSFQNRSSPSTSTNGKYVNWGSKHTELATQPWCCVGDLMSFCDKYEYRTLSLTDTRTHNNIIAEVKALLTVGQAPFDFRKRFPGNIHNPENLWVCIGRCASVEYHLKKILSVFRKPLVHLPVEKQRTARQNFHLAINELRLDISARISAVQLYDRNVFEREFHLHWQDT